MEPDRLLKCNFIWKQNRSNGQFTDDAFGKKYSGLVVFKHKTLSFRKLKCLSFEGLMKSIEIQRGLYHQLSLRQDK